MILDNVEFLPPIFYAVFLAAILKMADISKILKCRITPLVVTYNLSTADLRNYWTEFHETWWSYRYMFLVGPNVFSCVVKAIKVIF
jgi:hypothetical protein